MEDNVGNGNSSMIKVHYGHVWEYHNETQCLVQLVYNNEKEIGKQILK
jgi:hypothetical protein